MSASSPDGGGSAVQVVVRVRPLDSKERAQGCEDCSTTSATSIRLQAAGKNFIFDRVFDPRVDQKTIYDSSASKIVKKCFVGYNGTIFAYGQVGPTCRYYHVVVQCRGVGRVVVALGCVAGLSWVDFCQTAHT